MPGRRSSAASTKNCLRSWNTRSSANPSSPRPRRTYRLPDGSALEVNHVDAGRPTAFWYAEVEYPTVEAANAWQPAAWGLGAYLDQEVTGQPGQSMGAYWLQTRG